MNNLKHTILNVVEKNKIDMIPRWKFVLYSALGILGLLFSILALVFLASLLVFLLATSGFMYMPTFGLQETAHFLISIPILLFILAIVMLLVTETLARQYAFAFKKPIFVTLLFVTLLSITVGFLISQTPLHFLLRDYARVHHITMMRGMYDRPLPFEAVEGMTVLKGTILATSSGTIQVKLFDNRIVSVQATGTLPLPAFVEVGNTIILFGVMNENQIFEAFRVKPLGNFAGNGTKGGQGIMHEIKIRN